MTAKRVGYTEAENIALVAQVGSACPRCGMALLYTKSGRTYKQYQLAHIYPLNPRPEEALLLRDEERLHADVNHPDNIIPLCGNCHNRFDKPRTAEEYRELVHLKRQLIRSDQQAKIRAEYSLELDLVEIVGRLQDVGLPFDEVGLSYDLKSLGQKLRAETPPLLRQKIRHNVTDYYQFIRGELFSLEQNNPEISDLILQQVRAFYCKQRTLGLSQQQIFSNTVTWLGEKTKPKTIEAAEVLASFFVQNCEVFE